MSQIFVKNRSVSDILISSVLSVAGILMIVLTANVSVQIIGFLTLVIGVLLFFTLKSFYKNFETGEKFKKTMKYFEIGSKDAIINALDTDPSKIDCTNEGAGTGVLLEIFYNEENTYIQAYQFSSFQYEACDEMKHFQTSQVRNLIGPGHSISGRQRKPQR